MKQVKADIEQSLQLFGASNAIPAGKRVYWNRLATLLLKGDVFIWSGTHLGGGAADFNVAKAALTEVRSQQNSSTLDLQASYADIFEEYPQENSIDIVIVQDTLHHLEPMDDAMQIFRKTIKPNGILLSVEENGDNIVQRIKLYKQRGNKRIITFWDETLQRTITMGNENIRGLQTWKEIFGKYQFIIPRDSIQYIRYYYPFAYKNNNELELLDKEQRNNSKIAHKYFFFGINFIGINKK
jgi:SAM-dependent methyltransferase